VRNRRTVRAVTKAMRCCWPRRSRHRGAFDDYASLCNRPGILSSSSRGDTKCVVMSLLRPGKLLAPLADLAIAPLQFANDATEANGFGILHLHENGMLLSVTGEHSGGETMRQHQHICPRNSARSLSCCERVDEATMMSNQEHPNARWRQRQTTSQQHCRVPDLTCSAGTSSPSWNSHSILCFSLSVLYQCFPIVPPRQVPNDP
jgi:hypothetical protein